MSANDQTPTDQTPEGTDPAEGTPPAGTDPQDQDKPQGRQARRDEQARQRAAELETERDALAARLDARDRAEVTRLAGQILAEGSDLLDLGGVSLDDLRDDEGNVDPDEVAAMAAALADSRPGLAVPRPRGFHDWGHSRTSGRAEGQVYGGSEGTTWSDAFGAAGRGGQHYT